MIICLYQALTISAGSLLCCNINPTTTLVPRINSWKYIIYINNMKLSVHNGVILPLGPAVSLSLPLCFFYFPHVPVHHFSCLCFCLLGPSSNSLLPPPCACNHYSSYTWSSAHVGLGLTFSIRQIICSYSVFIPFDSPRDLMRLWV